MTHPMIVDDAKEFAGVFYDQKRSAKFRASWPSQMGYVNVNWERFVVHVRAAYAAMLTKRDVPQAQKDRIYDALIADAPASHNEGAAEPLQLAPDTEAFIGDKKENAHVEETYGKRAAKPLMPTAKRLLLNSTRH